MLNGVVIRLDGALRMAPSSDGGGRGSTRVSPRPQHRC
jgi:hypothetical protein